MTTNSANSTTGVTTSTPPSRITACVAVAPTISSANPTPAPPRKHHKRPKHPTRLPPHPPAVQDHRLRRGRPHHQQRQPHRRHPGQPRHEQPDPPGQLDQPDEVPEPRRCPHVVERLHRV